MEKYYITVNNYPYGKMYSSALEALQGFINDRTLLGNVRGDVNVKAECWLQREDVKLERHWQLIIEK